MQRVKALIGWAPAAAGGLFLLVFFSRVIALSKFVTVDEPAWILFSSNFFLALYKGEFQLTAIDYGVTTLWLLTLAFLSYFPGYRLVGRLTEKYWDVDKLLRKYHKEPLRLLVHGRFFSVLAISVLFVLAYNLLSALLGFGPALVALLMLAFDPFFLGNSRLLNHEALMVCLILVSIFAILVYLQKRHQRRYLLLSAAAAGLALLTKSPAVVLIPLVGLIFLQAYIQAARNQAHRLKMLPGFIADLALWLGILSLAFVLFWPGMWVAPGRMLYEVFGNALSNAFQGGRLAYTQGIQPQNFGLDPTGLVLYTKTILLKTTPVVWLGTFLSLLGLGMKTAQPMSTHTKQVVIYLGILGVLFVLLFGLARGRNHAHYVLTSFACLDIIAGIGYYWAVDNLKSRFSWLQSRLAPFTLLAGILILHGSASLGQYPYYYTYTNPLAQRLMPDFLDPSAGYGEGLEQAGIYLAQKPDAAHLKAMSWYAAGPFSYYFPGTTYNLLLSERVEEDYAARMQSSDFLVIYSIQQQPTNMPAKLLKALQAYTPDHVIWINGHEYVQIYRVADFPASFFSEIVN